MKTIKIEKANKEEKINIVKESNGKIGRYGSDNYVAVINVIIANRKATIKMIDTYCSSDEQYIPRFEYQFEGKEEKLSDFKVFEILDIKIDADNLWNEFKIYLDKVKNEEKIENAKIAKEKRINELKNHILFTKVMPMLTDAGYKVSHGGFNEMFEAGFIAENKGLKINVYQSISPNKIISRCNPIDIDNYRDRVEDETKSVKAEKIFESIENCLAKALRKIAEKESITKKVELHDELINQTFKDIDITIKKKSEYKGHYDGRGKYISDSQPTIWYEIKKDKTIIPIRIVSFEYGENKGKTLFGFGGIYINAQKIQKIVKVIFE